MTKLINIKWETDGEEIDLPSSLTLPENVEPEEEAINNWLSNTYGWLVSSYNIIQPTENLSQKIGKNMRELKAYKALLELGYKDEGENDKLDQENDGIILTLGHPNLDSIEVIFKYTGEL
jgi:hypothetical protein